MADHPIILKKIIWKGLFSIFRNFSPGLHHRNLRTKTLAQGHTQSALGVGWAQAQKRGTGRGCYRGPLGAGAGTQQEYFRGRVGSGARKGGQG